MEYIRLNRSKCDVLDSIAIQLKTLSSIHIRLEAELEDALERQI